MGVALGRMGPGEVEEATEELGGGRELVWQKISVQSGNSEDIGKVSALESITKAQSCSPSR